VYIYNSIQHNADVSTGRLLFNKEYPDKELVAFRKKNDVD